MAGSGAAWAADYEHPLIVRISPGRLDGEIAAVFGEDDHPSAGRGPRDMVAGLGSIWVDAADDEDPASGLECLDLDGRGQFHIERPGQIDALAAGDGRVWVAGFRRSQQTGVTTVLTGDGLVVGQVSFSSVDLRPWGMRYGVPRRGETYIAVYVAEHLLADGIETAVREVADGVTWLRWPRN